MSPRIGTPSFHVQRSTVSTPSSSTTAAARPWSNRVRRAPYWVRTSLHPSPWTQTSSVSEGSSSSGAPRRSSAITGRPHASRPTQCASSSAPWSSQCGSEPARSLAHGSGWWGALPSAGCRQRATSARRPAARSARSSPASARTATSASRIRSSMPPSVRRPRASPGPARATRRQLGGPRRDRRRAPDARAPGAGSGSPGRSRQPRIHARRRGSALRVTAAVTSGAPRRATRASAIRKRLWRPQRDAGRRLNGFVAEGTPEPYSHHCGTDPDLYCGVHTRRGRLGYGAARRMAGGRHVWSWRGRGPSHAHRCRSGDGGFLSRRRSGTTSGRRPR